MPNQIDPNKVVWEDDAIKPDKVQWYGAQAPQAQQESSVLDKLTSMRREAGLGQTPVEYLSGAAGNIPHSAMEFGKNVLYPFTNYVDFQSNLGQIAASPDLRQSVFDMYTKRLMNPAETFQQDPVGALADLSMVGSGVGLGSRIPGVAGRVAGGLGAAARAVDPLSMAGKAAGGAAKFAGSKVAAPAVGRIIGYSGESVSTAFKGGEVFRDWMRGDGEATEILRSVKGAVDDMADKRRADYQAGMQQITQSSQGALVDINPVKAEFNKRLRDFQVVADPQTGELDFSRVKGLTPALKDDITAIDKMLKDWGNKPDDFTVNGMDTLKQNLDNHFSAIGMGDRVDAFLKPVKDKLVQQIEQTAPGYTDVLKNYGRELELQKIIERAFSTKDPRTTETAIRKVEQALQDNNTYRTKLVEMMDSQTGSEIKEMIAGMNLKGMWPRSWLGASTDLTTIMAVMGGFVSPKFLAVLMVSSPRVVGEFANFAGRVYGMTSKGRNLIPRGVASRPAFQAGRMTQMTEQEF